MGEASEPTSTQRYRAYRDAIAAETLPAAVLDRDRLDANIRAVVERAAGKPVRVASKSIRSVTVLERILGADRRLQGVLCFSADEAVWLAELGFDDLVVAYPTVQPGSVRRVCRALRNGAHIVLMVDDPEHVRQLDAAAAEAGVVLPLCIDVDMSWRLPGLHFGVRRSPLSQPDEVVALYRDIARRDNVVLEGVMGYEAQISGVGDTPPGRRLTGAVIRALKRGAIPRIAERRRAVVTALFEAGARPRFVNGGGTGSLESTARDEAVTEVTAGSAFFSPHLFDHYRDFRHEPALTFALEVVRRPGPGYVTCQGGGYVASGAGGPSALPRPWLPEGLALDPQEGAGEVQTPLRIRGGARPAIGEPVFFRHAKAGELCERFREIAIVSGDGIVERVATYRGAGACFF